MFINRQRGLSAAVAALITASGCQRSSSGGSSPSATAATSSVPAPSASQAVWLNPEPAALDYQRIPGGPLIINLGYKLCSLDSRAGAMRCSEIHPAARGGHLGWVDAQPVLVRAEQSNRIIAHSAASGTVVATRGGSWTTSHALLQRWFTFSKGGQLSVHDRFNGVYVGSGTDFRKEHGRGATHDVSTNAGSYVRREYETCVMPAGYVHASWRSTWAPPHPSGPTAPWGRDGEQDMRLIASFWSHEEKVGQVAYKPDAVGHPARLYCDDQRAILSWTTADRSSIGRIGCDAKGCEQRWFQLPKPAPSRVYLAEVGSRTVIVWQAADARWLMLRAEFAALAGATPKALPLDPKASLGGAVRTGDSLVIELAGAEPELLWINAHDEARVLKDESPRK